MQKETGFEQVASHRHFATLDLVVIALLAALGNIISSLLDMLKPFFKASPIPFFQLLGGYHLIWMALGFGITRKHGAPTFVATIKGVLEFMFWDPFFGPWVIALNLVEGLMLDAGFYAFRRLRSERARWIIAGSLGNLLQPLVSYTIVTYYLGRAFPEYLLVATLFAVVSGAVIAGVLGYQLQKTVRRPDVQAFVSSG
ncbi:MAG: ECF transporter S component [Candidatus Lokiarchaeota archaeon]|nr:ECF transporter S component [Candidatus Lokiarchaeota archaeon]